MAARNGADGGSRTPDLRFTKPLLCRLSYASNGWWSQRDSNPRHPRCQRGALPRLSYGPKGVSPGAGTRGCGPSPARSGGPTSFSCRASSRGQGDVGSRWPDFGPLVPLVKVMVEATGIEPATSCLQGKCSPELSYAPRNGACEGDRTLDLRSGTPALYRLSYTRRNGVMGGRNEVTSASRYPLSVRVMVAGAGIEHRHRACAATGV